MKFLIFESLEKMSVVDKGPQQLNSCPKIMRQQLKKFVMYGLLKINSRSTFILNIVQHCNLRHCYNNGERGYFYIAIVFWNKQYWYDLNFKTFYSNVNAEHTSNDSQIFNYTNFIFILLPNSLKPFPYFFKGHMSHTDINNIFNFLILETTQCKFYKKLCCFTNVEII